jgi:hypothetical protein
MSEMTSTPQDAVLGWFEVGIAAVTFGVSLMGSAIAGTWVLGKSRDKVHAKINAVATEINEKIDAKTRELENKINSEADISSNRFGDSLSAMRQKLTDVELWNRDNFVSKQTFTLVIQETRSSWQRFEDKLDKRLDMIEAKLGPRSKFGSTE